MVVLGSVVIENRWYVIIGGLTSRQKVRSGMLDVY